MKNIESEVSGTIIINKSDLPGYKYAADLRGLNVSVIATPGELFSVNTNKIGEDGEILSEMERFTERVREGQLAIKVVDRELMSILEDF